MIHISIRTQVSGLYPQVAHCYIHVTGLSRTSCRFSPVYQYSSATARRLASPYRLSAPLPSHLSYYVQARLYPQVSASSLQRIAHSVVGNRNSVRYENFEKWPCLQSFPDYRLRPQASNPLLESWSSSAVDDTYLY